MPPLLVVVCWSVCHIATAADAVETLKGSWFSFRGLATRLRWPRLSFRRCTVMVPAEHTREGRGKKPGGIYLTGHVAMGDILTKCSLMAMVNLPSSPTPLSRKSYGAWAGLA